jgi:hypothetical protein
MDPITYREMRYGEEQKVCELVRLVFNEFVAPDYEASGIEEFFRFANPTALTSRVKAGGFVLVASTSDRLVGMLEFAPPDHIAMLFVFLSTPGNCKGVISTHNPSCPCSK